MPEERIFAVDLLSEADSEADSEESGAAQMEGATEDGGSGGAMFDNRRFVAAMTAHFDQPPG